MCRNFVLSGFEEELESLLTDVVTSSRRGVVLPYRSDPVPNWSFGQSLFFSGTVITTIGRGSVILATYEIGYTKLENRNWKLENRNWK